MFTCVIPPRNTYIKSVKPMACLPAWNIYIDPHMCVQMPELLGFQKSNKLFSLQLFVLQAVISRMMNVFPALLATISIRQDVPPVSSVLWAKLPTPMEHSVLNTVSWTHFFPLCFVFCLQITNGFFFHL